MQSVPKRKGRRAKQHKHLNATKVPAKDSRFFIGFIVLFIVSIGCVAFFNHHKSLSNKSVATNSAASSGDIKAADVTTKNPFKETTPFKTPKTLDELLFLSPEDLEKQDIALIDLICAQGLHGAEDLKIQECLDTIEQWTRHVENETKRNFHRFQENPETYNNSLAYYRMSILAMVLQQDFGVHYNPTLAALQDKEDKENNPGLAMEVHKTYHTDAKNMFIHGLLEGRHEGSCVSMPVLYAAIARRLGYPVYLAGAKSHFYIRYEEGNGEHLNVEATSKGIFTPPDSEYQEGVFAVSAEVKDAHRFQRPLKNSEWLGDILMTRSACLMTMKQFEEESKTVTQASRFLSSAPLEKEWLANVQRRSHLDQDAERWETLWDEVGSLQIPQGPEAWTVHFENCKAKIHYFMNDNNDLAAVQASVDLLKANISEYQKQLILAADSQQKIPMPDRQLYLKITSRSGKPVRIPVECLPPPLDQGVLEPGYIEAVIQSGAEDMTSMLTELWKVFRIPKFARGPQSNWPGQRALEDPAQLMPPGDPPPKFGAPGFGAPGFGAASLPRGKFAIDRST